MRRRLFMALFMKELRGFLAQRGMALFALLYAPAFVLFMSLFIYPAMGDQQFQTPLYKTGIVFVMVYPLTIVAFMGLGHAIVIEALQGWTLKIATMPIERHVEALARLTGHLAIGATMTSLSLSALCLGAYLRGIVPVPTPLSLHPLVLLSIPAPYFAAAGMALPLAAIAAGRIQLYNYAAVLAINLLPFLSGMFLPMFMLPSAIRTMNQFNPFAAPFFIHMAVENGPVAPAIGIEWVAAAAYGTAGVILLGGLYVYSKAAPIAARRRQFG